MAKMTKQLDKRINKVMMAAANVIKESCKTKHDCDGCPFSKTDDLEVGRLACKFDNPPMNWELGK